jgi:hypothetical protein
MASKRQTIKGRWNSYSYNSESQEFSASWKAKAKGLDPVTGFLRVVHSADKDGFEWYTDSNKSSVLETGSDFCIFRGQAAQVDTNAFFEQAREGAGVFRIKELKTDLMRATLSSGDVSVSVADYGGWRFSSLFNVLSDL